jgi:oligopeptidase B
MTAYQEFQKELFEEMKARIKEDDESVPYLYNGYYYITVLKRKGLSYLFSKERESFGKRRDHVRLYE